MKLNNKPLNFFNLLEQMRLGDYLTFKYNKSTIGINLDYQKSQNNENKILYYFECDTMGEELDCKLYSSIDELLNNALIEGRKINDVFNDIELVYYHEPNEQKCEQNNDGKNVRNSKKIIVGLILGIIIGLIIGIIIGFCVKMNTNNDEYIGNSTIGYDKKFVGKWEYNTKYEDIEVELNKTLNSYREKYVLKPTSSGCICDNTNGNILVSNYKTNNTLLINNDGTVEYFEYWGYITNNCEVEIKTNYHYKGTFENSRIVFKQAESNGTWQDFRSVHTIYLVDDDTLHYKVNDENPSSATYLFIKMN